MRIVITTVPVAQPRQRHAIIAGRVHNYTPTKSPVNAFKAALQMAVSQHIKQPIEGPIRMDVDFYLPRPKRLLRKSDPDGPMPHTAKPDLDNLCKSLMDAWRGLVWRDDSQVWNTTACKWYAEKDGVPRVEIEISEAEEAEAG